jgi:hypothetical protein
VRTYIPEKKQSLTCVRLASAEEQLKTMPVQTASGRFGGDVVERLPACREDTSVSA